MPIYKPSELRQFLESLNISPKKVLSQNFLIDGNIIRKIVETAQVAAEDLILEIGPGPGALTEALLSRGAHVVAVEKDRVLASALERLSSSGGTLEVHCSDIMELPIEQLISRRAKVIANLPYHLTTPILSSLVQHSHLFESLTVMVQEEVARRFAADPNTSDYSSFTLFLKMFADVHYDFLVSKNCFYPVPNVESAVVTFRLHEPVMKEDRDLFFKMTRLAFSHRRKMLKSSLREMYPSERIEQSLEHLGLNPKARPENLSLEEWIRLFKDLRT